MEEYIKCPYCGNDKWELEVDHAHCSECQEVIHYDELHCLLLHGKRLINKLVDDFLKEDELWGTD